jgi:cyanophycinase-like exopeptidase
MHICNTKTRHENDEKNYDNVITFSGAHRIFFRGGGQSKNITHFTINKIMQILNIFSLK